MLEILIVDDHPIVRKDMIQLLEDDSEKRFSSIKEAGNRKEMLEMIRIHNFDVILLDISIPGRNGLELLSEIKKIKPSLPVLMLSIHPEEQYAIRSIKMGASGYLNKASQPGDLITAIIRVSKGGKYISPSLAEKLAQSYFDDMERPLHENLSVREQEVVIKLASGMTLIEISKELSLSPKTISTYRERILTKLQLKTTSDIIRYAIKKGLIS